MLKDAGYDVTIASPNGGAVPVDPASLEGDFKTPEAERMLNDGGSCNKVSAAIPCQCVAS